MLHLLLAAMITTQATDTATTLRLLHTGRYHEANRLLPTSPTGIVLTKAGVTLGVTALAWHWRTTHPRLAKTILVIGTGSGTYGTIHNLSLK